MYKPELLAPAGDLQRLKIAVLYGADAVFIGGKYFSLRAKANNFSMEDIKEGVSFAHQHHAKVYVTVNIVPDEGDFNHLEQYLIELDQIGVDAIILSSISVFLKAKSLNCKFELHISTQHSILNSKAVEFFKDLKAHRVVLAREATIENIQHIKNKTAFPLEVFIHGGMCSSFSGRCGLSNVMVKRDANKGGCAHSCRWDYELFQNQEKISEFPFALASTDLMGIDYIPQLIDAKIDSFKIEGRMKSAYYIANVVRIYRQFIDEYLEKKNISKKRINEYKTELLKLESRSLSCGFFNPILKNEGLLTNNNSEQPSQSFIAYVLENSDENCNVLIEQRNYFSTDNIIEIIQPNQPIKETKILEMRDENNQLITIARHPQQILKIKLPFSIQKDSFIRRK